MMSLKPLFAWLLFLNAMTITPYTFGPLAFPCLLGSVWLLYQCQIQVGSPVTDFRLKPFFLYGMLLAPYLVFYWFYHQPSWNILGTETSLPYIVGSAAFAFFFLLLLFFIKPSQVNHEADKAPRALYALLGLSILIAIATSIASMILQPDFVIDMAQNTYAAIEHFMQGNNPYTHEAQLLVKTFPEGTPNLSIENEQIYMFGIPYYHGYPYYPSMMLAYTPISLILDGYNSLRVTNLLLVILNIIGFSLISKKLVTDKQQQGKLFLLATVAYIGILRYAFEAVGLVITDVLISTLLVYTFVAIIYQHYGLAGLLLGLAQSSKLLPAPFVFLAISLMLWPNKKQLFQFVAAFTVSTLLILIPFFLWDPQGFISATFLYYLTHHEGGDITSLWYFLPTWLQPLVLAIGPILTFGSIFYFMRKLENKLLGCLIASYSCYVIFMAFSKMSHLNYLWAVYPLGCIALAMILGDKHFNKKGNLQENS